MSTSQKITRQSLIDDLTKKGHTGISRKSKKELLELCKESNEVKQKITCQSLIDDLTKKGHTGISRKSKKELLELCKESNEKQPQKVKSTERNTIQSKNKGTSHSKEKKLLKPNQSPKENLHKSPERVKYSNIDIQERINQLNEIKSRLLNKLHNTHNKKKKKNISKKI